MIFKPELVELIRDRRKTQTRRPVKPMPNNPQRLEEVCRYKVGRVYSVQPGRGQRGVLQITVLDARREPLGDLTPQDARREGFRFTAEFFAYWERLYGSVDREQLVWVISFAVGDISDRFDRPNLLTSIGHVGQVTYDRVAGKPGGRGRHRWPKDDPHTEDYTDRPERAMPGEPEALTQAQLAPLVKDAHLRDSLLTRTERAGVEVGERIQRLEARAHSGDQQAQRALFVIHQRLEKAERGESREVAA